MTTSSVSAPILILGCTAYTLQSGCLASCEVISGGTALEQQDGQPNWVDVMNFELESDTQREIDRAFTALVLLDDVGRLAGEYKSWCAAENVPWVSADEQDLEALDEEQRRYIGRFMQRWEFADERGVNREARPRTLSHNRWLCGELAAAPDRY